ncbi:PIR Superfamily Protein [Plasmodium ovale wallikeri]|uniref:PIR Superfamily Protein n=1 Tax=Plasmodium ovale wallikeri TaxID=864142 RepID=A0A1A9AHJ9_PLAOA|nr:PIR Superfamily Protein [Plasmodium ovale wallikeri]
MCKNYDEKCMEYYQYIKEKSSLYEHFEKICTPEQSNCSHFYEKYRAHNPTLVLPTLICHEKFKADNDPPAETTDLKTSVGHELQSGDYGLGVLEPAAELLGKDSTPQNSKIGKKVCYSLYDMALVLLNTSVLYRVPRYQSLVDIIEEAQMM